MDAASHTLTDDVLAKRDEDSSDNFRFWSDQPASYIFAPLSLVENRPLILDQNGL